MSLKCESFPGETLPASVFYYYQLLYVYDFKATEIFLWGPKEDSCLGLFYCFNTIWIIRDTLWSYSRVFILLRKYIKKDYQMLCA
jgi:hypothetical protein